MKGFTFTAADAEKRRARGLSVEIVDIADPKTSIRPATASTPQPATSGPLAPEREKAPIKRPEDRMNKTERRMADRLEAEKRREEVLEYRFEGISLSWGADPATGKPMWYTPDFYVRPAPLRPGYGSGRVLPLVIEVKGGFIRPQDLIRFKGCRAEWGHVFAFELWQWKGGDWKQLA